MSFLIEAIGDEAQPLVTFDDFAADPDGLRDFASTSIFEQARNHYPGVRAALPTGYLDEQLPVIAAAARAAFGRSGPIEVIDASFSVVSTPREALTVSQRLPHVDAFGADRIALVHYLSVSHGEGTAFFRHRATGFETVTEDRRDIFFRHLETQLRHGGLPLAAYVAGDSELFECVHAAGARYNRALLYRSWNLHSGAIGAATNLSPDPRDGRLTVTAFLSIG